MAPQLPEGRDPLESKIISNALVVHMLHELGRMTLGEKQSTNSVTGLTRADESSLRLRNSKKSGKNTKRQRQIS